LVCLSPGEIKHEFAVGMTLGVDWRRADDLSVIRHKEVVRYPASFRHSATSFFERGKQLVTHEWVVVARE